MDTTRPALAHLDVGGIEPQVGIGLARERPAAEGLDLGVERGADAAHLAPADRGDAQGLARGPPPGACETPST